MADRSGLGPLAITLRCLEVWPGKPVACNYRLLCLDYGLLWAIVAYDFGLLGTPMDYTEVEL